MSKTLFLITLIFSPAVFAGKSANQDVREFMQSYINGYNSYLSATQDPTIEGATKHFSEPTVLVSQTRAPGVVPSHQELGKGLTYFVNGLQKAGAAKLDWEKLDIYRFDESHALASGIARITDVDGEVIDRRASIYSIFKADNGWQILLNQSIPVENSPSFR